MAAKCPHRKLDFELASPQPHHECQVFFLLVPTYEQQLSCRDVKERPDTVILALSIVALILLPLLFWGEILKKTINVTF